MRARGIFTAAMEQRVVEAIRLAESKTSGEMVPLVVEQSHPYPHMDFIGGMIGQFLSALILLWVLPARDYGAIFAVQVLGFLAGFLAFRHIPALKRLLLPPKTVEEEVFERALRAFHELELSRTRDRTGVLILVSLMERRVQVLADSGINARVKPATWEEVVRLVLVGIRAGDLCGGLCQAIARCGDILAGEFPARPEDVNELPDQVLKG